MRRSDAGTFGAGAALLVILCASAASPQGLPPAGPELAMSPVVADITKPSSSGGSTPAQCHAGAR
jgi:hypothetical protein